MTAPAAPAPTRRPSPKLRVYTGLAATALLAGLALGRPELVALGAPMALLVVAGLAMAREPEVELDVAIDRERAVEGDEVVLTLTVRSAAPVARLELVPLVPDRLSLPGQPRARSIRLAAGERARVELRLRCERWGAQLLGGVHLRAHDPLRLFAWEWFVAGDQHPGPRGLRRRLAGQRLPRHARPSRARELRRRGALAPARHRPGDAVPPAGHADGDADLRDRRLAWHPPPAVAHPPAQGADRRRHAPARRARRDRPLRPARPRLRPRHR